MNADRHAPLFAAVLIALPTLISYYPPMSDLPMHEGVIGAMRHFGDKTYFPDDIYLLNIGHPNQLFHTSAFALSWIVGTRWAVKIVIALTQVAIFHSGARFADHLGRSRWGAILLAPLALGFTYYWGLVANLTGFAAFLYALPTIDSMVQAPTRKAVLRTCGAMMLLFFAHESMFVMAAAVTCLFTVAQPLDRKLTPLRLASVVFAMGVGVAHYFYQQQFFPKKYSSLSVASVWFTLTAKVQYLANVIVGSYDWFVQVLLFGLGVVSMIALVIGRLKNDEKPAAIEERGLRRWRARLFRYRFETVAAIFLGFYWVMPYNWKGVTLLHERFLGPAWALTAILVCPKGAPSRLARFAAMVSPIAIVLAAWPQFAEANLSYQRLDALMEKIPFGESVSECILDRRDPFSRVFSVGPGVARALSVRGGRVSIALTGSPISPVRIKPEFVWWTYDVRMYVYGSRAFMPTYDFARWHYLIAQSRVPEYRGRIREALEPEADLIAEEGEWMLFKAKHPSLPATARDEAPPDSAMEDTVLHRVLRIDSRQRAERASDAGALPQVPPPGEGRGEAP